MTRRSDIEKAGEERRAAIRSCRACDPSGWKLGPDGLTADIAIRCTHDASSPPASPVVDITEPRHQPDLFDDTKENR